MTDERAQMRLQPISTPGRAEHEVMFESLPDDLIDPVIASAAPEFLRSVNVSQVKHLSPFRYPGGKTWLVPVVREWLADLGVERLVEPFAGGGSCGLMAAAESLCSEVVLGELDSDVSAVWDLLINGAERDVDWLCKKILAFEVSLPNVVKVANTTPRTPREHAFRTIVRNRTSRGGILAPGAGYTKTGEANRGLASRWYPETLVKRIKTISELRPRLRFVQGDAHDLLTKYRRNKRTAWFVDPPYTAGVKRAGSRLYAAHQLDHERLFARSARLRGPVMMTYDESAEVLGYAEKYGFQIQRVPMKSTHHALHRELVLSRT